MMPLDRSSFFRLSAAAMLATAAGVADASVGNPLASMTKATRRSIVEVRLFTLDPEIQTRVAVTPARFLTFPGVAKRVHADRATIDAFFKEIARAAPAPNRYGIDTRYGAVFASHHGIVTSAFFDGTLGAGTIGTVAVDVDKPSELRALYDWGMAK